LEFLPGALFDQTVSQNGDRLFSWTVVSSQFSVVKGRLAGAACSSTQNEVVNQTEGKHKK
jgi:hypothetical protein